MIDICCVGHITSDKVVTTKAVKHMAGGTAWYFSCALANFDINYLLVTALATTEMHYVSHLRQKGICVNVQPSDHTVYFENIYAENQDERTQNVLQMATAFKLDPLLYEDAQIYHLGPLLSDDIPVPLIKYLASKGLVSLDVQGYLRKVLKKKVHAVNWLEKREALQYVTILKADEAELQALTGCKEVSNGAQKLIDWGVKEVVITNGSKGSVIYCNSFVYTIPAWQPHILVDATGCGDTYMAAYLYQRVKGEGPQSSGEFAASMASLKMESSGAFTGTVDDVKKFLTSNK